jgi:hypothetical protein
LGKKKLSFLRKSLGKKKLSFLGKSLGKKLNIVFGQPFLNFKKVLTKLTLKKV